MARLLIADEKMEKGYTRCVWALLMQGGYLFMGLDRRVSGSAGKSDPKGMEIEKRMARENIAGIGRVARQRPLERLFGTG